MKPLDLQNHYEVLEVPQDAEPQQIEKAYRVVRASYADDSLALYSVFDPGDAAAIRERIDLAYRVLSDPEARGRYDAEVLGGGQKGPESASPATEDASAAMAPFSQIEAIHDEEHDAEISGAWLRRARLRRGIDLEQIAAVTKISPTYLRLLEEEGFDELPAPVYVRGFVTAYARSIGVDPAPVAPRYMERLEASRRTPRGGRLLGLR